MADFPSYGIMGSATQETDHMNQSAYFENATLDWLLERDPDNPGVRYFTLRDLVGRSENDPELIQAKAEIMSSGPVPAILEAQSPQGYWVRPGGGYTPSYRGSIWQIMFLACLGADPEDERVRKGCEYIWKHSVAANGAFSMNRNPIPSKVIHCLNGDLIAALSQLGYADDFRLEVAIGWAAGAIVGGEDIRFYKSGTTGPGFACAYNGGQPCAWGAIKTLKGLVEVPKHRRTPAIQDAIARSIEFLLSRDPSEADYPYVERVNKTWFQFGFPLSYRSDVLEVLEVLTSAGYGSDPRLDNAKKFLQSKRDGSGRWKMEKSLNGKMWFDVEKKGQPSKWITLRALRVLKANRGLEL